MRLDRAHVTRASQVMLPTYVGFFAVIGLNDLITPDQRLAASPVLSYAGHVMPLPAWGGVFLTAALLMLLALFSNARKLYQYALLVCALSMAVWTVVDVFAAVRSQATWGGWAYPALVVAACVASYRSLNTREAD